MRALVDGVWFDGLPLDDRGLQYGDGLFETLLLSNCKTDLWALHLSRLSEGCRRLQINYKVDYHSLLYRINKVADAYGRSNEHSNCVIKVIVTRGSGGRGYNPISYRQMPEPREIIAAYPGPKVPSNLYREGIFLKLLAYRLSSNSMLSGIKHLNRLDQVLASVELGVSAFEGLTSDAENRVVEGTRSNVFFWINDRICTPRIHHCGIDGVMREFILDYFKRIKGSPIEVVDIATDRIKDIQAAAIVNSVMGVLPVKNLDNQLLDTQVVIKELQSPVKQALQAM